MDKVLQYIPQVLLYIIPGFISVRIKEIWRNQKRHDQFGYIVFCVMYSFISLIIYKAIRFLAKTIWPALFELLKNSTVEICGCIAIGAVLGIIIAKLPTSSIGQIFMSIMRRNTATDKNVWQDVMCNENGAWAQVYLRNGMIYNGELIDYTGDPDEELKEIVLYNYWLYMRKEGDIKTSKDFMALVSKCTQRQDKVLIKRDDIISIEVFSGLDESLKERAITILDKKLKSKEGTKYINVPEYWQEEVAVLHYQPKSTNLKWIDERLPSWRCTKQSGSEKRTQILQIKKGILWPSKVLATVAIRDDNILIAAYAEEKLHRHNSAEKIVERISRKIPRKGTEQE